MLGALAQQSFKRQCVMEQWSDVTLSELAAALREVTLMFPAGFAEP